MGYSSNRLNIDYRIIVLLLIVVFFVFYSLIIGNSSKNGYTKLEEEMVVKAREYVSAKNISTNKEIYFDVSKLGIILDDKCSFTSGVIYDGKKYTPYLNCTDYKSDIIEGNKAVKKYITLKGEEVMFLAKGMKYYDPGYISKDVVISAGNIGTQAGVYNIYYKAKNSNSIATRKLIILDSQHLRSMFPTIELYDDEIVYTVEGEEYIDAGVIGTDSVDGDISEEVQVEGDIDINTPGEYTLTYVLTNSRGYSATITRDVIVVDRESDLIVGYRLSPETYTNEDVTIHLKINSEFDRIIYPDGMEGNLLYYTATENGKYHFTIYDKFDRVVEKDVLVDNIDKVPPTGKCTATTYYDRTEVVVTNTTKTISSYEYIVNNQSSGNTLSNKYVSSVVKPASVHVKIKDEIDNQTEITCGMINKSVREITTNAKGKNCLSGMICYVQYDYGNATKYPYCSKQNKPNSCNGIGKNGCSITATSIAIAAMGVRSKTGIIHTPYTVWDELYPINKMTGECNGGCSAWSRMRDAIINAGLSAPKNPFHISSSTVKTMIEHLQEGYPIIVHAGPGPYTGTGHYMTILGIRSDGYIFLSDPAQSSGTARGFYEDKSYSVDTWIPIEDLLTGNVDEALLVGPAGMYAGK